MSLHTRTSTLFDTKIPVPNLMKLRPVFQAFVNRDLCYAFHQIIDGKLLMWTPLSEVLWKAKKKTEKENHNSMAHGFLATTMEGGDPLLAMESHSYGSPPWPWRPIILINF